MCVGLDDKSQNKSRVRKRRRYSNCSNSSSNSGDEWIPALENCVMKKNQMISQEVINFKLNMNVILLCLVLVVETAVRDPLCDIAEHV